MAEEDKEVNPMKIYVAGSWVNRDTTKPSIFYSWRRFA